MGENHTVHQHITVQAPADEVYQALTEADKLEGWFPSQVRSDPRQGGSYRFEFQYPEEGKGGTQEGKYLAVEPGQQVSYTWKAGGNETRVVFTLTPLGEKTEVDLQHTGFGSSPEAEKVRDMHGDVWNAYMTNLKSYLETGEDKRTAMLGQITR